MQTKLTLRLEAELIVRAKAWAKTHKVSLSHAVSEFFSHVSEKRPPHSLSPWTQGLSGIASDKAKAPSNDEIRRDHLDYLETKHQ